MSNFCLIMLHHCFSSGSTMGVFVCTPSNIYPHAKAYWVSRKPWLESPRPSIFISAGCTLSFQQDINPWTHLRLLYPGLNIAVCVSFKRLVLSFVYFLVGSLCVFRLFSSINRGVSWRIMAYLGVSTLSKNQSTQAMLYQFIQLISKSMDYFFLQIPIQINGV